MTKELQLKDFQNLKLCRDKSYAPQFIEYSRWLASCDKKPKTQRGLALKLGLTEQTLSNWKDKYSNELGYNVKHFIKAELGTDMLPIISKALKTNIKDKNDTRSIEIVLKWLGMYEDMASNDTNITFQWSTNTDVKPKHVDAVDVDTTT